MRVCNHLILPIIILSIVACAGNRPTSDNKSTTDYVEVSNPGVTISPDQPATIWVPKTSVDTGPPRGSELIKKAYDSVTSSQTDTTAQQSSVLTAPATPAVAVPAKTLPAGMRIRAAILEIGSSQLAIPFKEKLRDLPGSPVIAIPPEAGAEKLLSREDRAAFAVKAWQDSGVNMSLFISAPDGLVSGRSLSVEIYDGMGSGLISKIETVIPTNDSKDSAAVVSSLSILAERTRDAIAQLPWYAKVVAVESGKVYINAGREAGINLGQRLNVIRGGKAVPGLGFAPGAVVGTIEVSGFVGSNGATALLKDGVQVYPNDIIAAE